MAIEKGLEDVRAVLDAVGSERTALFGADSGGAVALLFAASYPERVSAIGLLSPLVVWGTAAGIPGGSEDDLHNEWTRRARTSWGTPEFWKFNAESMGEGAVSDEEAEIWARFMRLCASPQTALAIDAVERQIDVRSLLPHIQVPTLVMLTTGDLAWDKGRARWVAEQIPGGRYTELLSPIHFPRDPALYAPFQEFLASVHEQESIFDRVLATVLFTDIVDSTRKAAGLGDRSWRELVERHHLTVRGLIARFRGTEVDTAGDGFFATFDGPARAVFCARAITDAVRPLGLEVRTGVHTGEVETIDGKVGGLGVVIGSRVAGLAGPSEVLVTQTVKDLTAGSGIVFADAGEHELKGIPESWHLFRVANAPT